jgi:ribosomal protein L37AE/L43A
LPDVENLPRARGCHADSDIDRRLDLENEQRQARMRECEEKGHNLINAIRLGRAHWICPHCESDITKELFLMFEAECG